ncbi:UDP-2,3-diacylglucosamine diphosphatase [Daejeonella sp.]|uniref:UDP-2,3-diacylglucosamine diphosphatase n=1 Tax=Daejeonella sp. TaxID=2805397 RepID=UPI0030BE2F89
MPGTKIYFASDFHLGVPDRASSREREDRLVRWLDVIKADASEIFLMGDIFDFWFEYRTVIPRGFIRFQGKLAELSDSGIKITFFKGNHDMWMFDYFGKEMGIDVVSDELILDRNGKKFYLHHGDGLGPGDEKYKILKKIFRSKTCQWLFARLHPNLGVGIAQRWSRSSRAQNARQEVFEDAEHEWLYTHSRDLLQNQYYDFLIFGHRHLPLNLKLGESRYINLGEWLSFNSYAVFDGENLELKYFEQEPA